MKRRSANVLEVERALGDLINEGRIYKNEENHYQNYENKSEDLTLCAV